MPNFIFPPHDPVSLPIAGTDKRFPVRRIYCIGKNYAKHVKEMGGDVSRSEPIFFTKAPETIVQNGEDILENGMQKPIYVRKGKGRYVLQEGLHRMEAMLLLGETLIEAHIVAAQRK